MQSIFKTFGFVILTLFTLACASKIVTVADKEPAPTKEYVKANFSDEQLAQGQTLYENNCAKCHDLKDPGSRNPEEWNNVLKRMIPKAQLAYEDGRLVRAYLVAHSK
jgi:cytochrome c5